MATKRKSKQEKKEEALSANETPAILFCIDDKWVMKIERDKEGASIKFNTEDHPNCMANDFAKAVCDILCQSEYLDHIYFGREAKENDN